MSEEQSEKNEDNPYLNNPLHGVGLEAILKELVDYYGFDILHAYLNIKCFKLNPSISASVKFLKKTDWARKKIEVLYLYQYKNLPSVTADQFELPPRERIIPMQKNPREPAVLTIEEGLRLQEERARNFTNRNSSSSSNNSSRAYNERNKTRQNKSLNNSRSDKPSYYKSVDSSSNDTDGRKPSPAKDPWANAKKEK